MAEQYFTLSQLQKYTPSVDISTIELMSTDSYSDEEIWRSIISTGDITTLALCALQIAIVGSGNKTFGRFKYKGVEKTIIDVFHAKGIKTSSGLGSKLQSGELTPRRLVRAFRLFIKNYLEKNELVSSYMWRKYSDKDEKFRTICYPGSEHLIGSDDEAMYIYNAYTELDLRQNSNISERILRVLNARGLLLRNADKLK
jgi:hypothetical protein